MNFCIMKKRLYKVVFGFWFSTEILSHTMLRQAFPVQAEVFSSIQAFLCLLLLGVEITGILYYTKKEAVALVILSLLVAVSTILAGNRYIASAWLFIIAAKNEKIDELVRIAAIALCITIPGVFILYFFGMIGEQTIYRGCLERRSWGFENVDQLGAYVLQLMLCCYYINRQKIRSKDMIWLAAAVLFLLLVPNSLTAACCLMLLAVLHMIYRKCLEKEWKTAYVRYLACMSLLLVVVQAVCAMLNIQDTGVTNSYNSLFRQYGIVMYLLASASYIYTMFYLGKQGEGELVTILFLCSLAGLRSPCWYRLTNNVFLLTIADAFYRKTNGERQVMQTVPVMNGISWVIQAAMRISAVWKREREGRLKIKPWHKQTFWSAFIVGILTHIYMLTNKLSFGDDIHNLFNVGATYSSGRWMLGLLGEAVDKIYGLYSLPWLNGLISIVFIAVSAAILADILEIRSMQGCVLAGSIMSVFPTVFSTFAVMYTAPYYFFSVLLTVIAVYMIKEYSYIGSIGGVILIALAMGIYHAYFPIATASLLGVMILKCGFSAENIKSLLKTAGRYLVSLCMGLALYFILTYLACYFTSTELSAYRGIDQMGLSQYPELVARAYEKWYLLTTSVMDLSCTPFVMYLFRILTVIFILMSFVNIIMVWRKERCKGLLLTMLYVAVPLAVNLIFVMTSSKPNPIMEYGFVIALLLFITIGEKMASGEMRGSMLADKIQRGYKMFCHYGVLWSMAGIISVYVCYANVEYFRAEFIQSQAQSFFTVLITRIESVEGYKADMPVVFVGRYTGIGEDRTFDWENYKSGHYFTRLDGLLNHGQTMKTYIQRWNGFAPVWGNPDDVKDLPEVQAMTVYPNDGSLRIVNNMMVIKFSE